VGEDDDASKEVSGASNICNSEQGRDKHQLETDMSMGTRWWMQCWWTVRAVKKTLVNVMNRLDKQEKIGKVGFLRFSILSLYCLDQGFRPWLRPMAWA